MRLSFTHLQFVQITHDGISHFEYREDTIVRTGYTMVTDAASERSFCAVIDTGTRHQPCTIFTTGIPTVCKSRSGIMI